MTARRAYPTDRLRPETDPALLERHRVEDAAERLRLLAALAHSRAPLALHVGGACGDGVPARLERIDPGSGSVEIGIELPPHAQAACRMALRSAGRATGVAIQVGAKLQFALDGITAATDATHGALRAALPTTLVRLQRRDAYRIAPSPLADARLCVSDPAAPGPVRPVAVADLSATGVSFRLPAAESAPRLGARLYADPLELPATLPIRCGLRVCTVEPAAEDMQRVGCAFEGLEPAAARAVQVFVNAAQVRSRRPRPRIGSPAPAIVGNTHGNGSTPGA